MTLRGIALKIFLSFWLIHAFLILALASLPDRTVGTPFFDRIRESGLVAAALFETHGRQTCQDFSAAVERTMHVQFALVDARNSPVCRSPSFDAGRFAPYLAAPQDEDLIDDTSTGRIVLIRLRSPNDAVFAAAALEMRGAEPGFGPPPLPYDAIALAIVLSGIVCFALARYLARPLQQVRAASHRIASGDLQARAGAQVSARHDEIGDLVRDFDVMADRLEALVTSQTQLLSDMSHELRSPLARLNVALELARRKSGGEARADLDRIEAEASRMNDLIGRILALARAESHENLRARKAIDLGSMVREIAADAHYEAQRQGRSVVAQVEDSLVVQADAAVLASAIDNVVRNAVRYTPEHSTVEVRLKKTSDGACVTVRDFGPGVPDSHLERIFAAFHRVEAGRSAATGGVGLGLAIARRAVAVHGGTIAAENARDGGLQVTIRLPVHPPDAH